MTRFGFLSTYPPTRCGLATFTEALSSAIAGLGEPEPRIVRVVDVASPFPSTPVGSPVVMVGELVAGNPRSVDRTIRALDQCDVAVVQHEYGIYGGADGDEVIAVLQGLATPAIVVLHTVLAEPTAHQREVLEQVCRLASAVVVMTHTAVELLTAHYTVAMDRVTVIPHGVTPLLGQPTTSPGTGTSVLTWGLIGPGKGIEWGIRAMALLRDLPRLRYTVIGQTHPKVLAHEGEAYRESLVALIRELGLQRVVKLDDRYLTLPQLVDAAGAADVVLLPYDSTVQITSGVLVEAISAGIPVVTTGFPHAVELIDESTGLIVNHQDPAAIAKAIRDTVARKSERVKRHPVAPGTSWPEVAAQYRALAASLLSVKAA